MENEYSQEFQEWLDDFNSRDDEEKKKIILDKVKEQVSEEDRAVLDEMIDLLRDHPDEFTDLVWLEDHLKERHPDINPLAILSYFLILNMSGYLSLDKS